MGWTKQRLLEEGLYQDSGTISDLWNTFRDAVGLAVSEFNDAVAEADRVIRDDCTSLGPYCLRVRRKASGKSWEFFLSLKNRTLEYSPGPEEPKKSICGYRATQDLKRLEFYSLDEAFVLVPGLAEDDSEPNMFLPAEKVCEMALGELFFDPLPRPPYRL